MSYNNLGSLLINTGDFNEAEEFLRKSLEMRQALFGDLHPKVTLTLNNLGIVHRNRGDFEQAIALMTRSLSINRELFGDDALQTGMGLFSQAELYLMTGEYDLAHQNYQKAHDIFIKRLPEGSSFSARTQVGMGQALLNTADTDADLAVATDQITEGFTLVQQIHPEQSIEFGLAAAAVGELHIKLGQQTTGLDYLTMAHNIISKIEGEESFRSQKIEEMLFTDGDSVTLKTNK
jgi:serine/threonine-protein kinase